MAPARARSNAVAPFHCRSNTGRWSPNAASPASLNQTRTMNAATTREIGAGLSRDRTADTSTRALLATTIRGSPIRHTEPTNCTDEVWSRLSNNGNPDPRYARSGNVTWACGASVSWLARRPSYRLVRRASPRSRQGRGRHSGGVPIPRRGSRAGRRIFFWRHQFRGGRGRMESGLCRRRRTQGAFAVRVWLPMQSQGSQSDTGQSQCCGLMTATGSVSLLHVLTLGYQPRRVGARLAACAGSRPWFKSQLLQLIRSAGSTPAEERSAPWPAASVRVLEVRPA